MSEQIIHLVRNSNNDPVKPNYKFRKIVAIGVMGIVALAGAKLEFGDQTTVQSQTTKELSSGGELTVTTTTEGSRFQEQFGHILERVQAVGPDEITGSAGVSDIAARAVEAMGLPLTPENIQAATVAVSVHGGEDYRPTTASRLGDPVHVNLAAFDYDYHRGDPSSQLSIDPAAIPEQQ